MSNHGCPPTSVVTGLVVALLLNSLAYAAPQTPQPAPPSQTEAAEPAVENQEAAPATVPPSQPDAQSDSTELPDSPGATQANQAPTPSATTQDQQAQPQPQQPTSPTVRHEPLGTAAAESVPTSGVAASRPAGAALAPAKQRRVRSILIAVGAVVGVGVALGATMALSQGSPSKPPGSN